MAITRPDEYRHNNQDLAIADSDNVRGARRTVPDRDRLYALASKADQLKENVTIVRILSDDENGGVVTEVILVDDSAIGSSAGWELHSSGAAAPSPGGGGSLTLYKFTRDVSQPGANTFDLPTGAVDVLPAVKVQQASPYPQRPVRILLDDHYRVAGGQLIISEAAGLNSGDTVVGTAYSGGGSGGTGRDNNNVAQSVRDAVSDASNLWDYGDLATYGTTDLQNAALDGVVKGDFFDAFEQGSTVDAYRYCYCLQNGGSLGWTRLLKYN